MKKHLSPDVFTKISDPDEKKIIYDDLAKAKIELLTKSLEPQAHLNILNPYEFQEPFLFCQLKTSMPVGFKSEEMLIISFTLSEVKYFTQCPVEVKTGLRETVIKLNTTGPIYKLQRRENFRIKIPKSYPMFLEVLNWTSTAENMQTALKIEVIDLSAGGCKIHYRDSQIPLMEKMEINGILHIPDRDSISCLSRVCYLQKDSSNKHFSFAGLEFMQFSEIQKNRLAAFVMDLYREFFT